MLESVFYSKVRDQYRFVRPISLRDVSDYLGVLAVITYLPPQEWARQPRRPGLFLYRLRFAFYTERELIVKCSGAREAYLAAQSVPRPLSRRRLPIHLRRSH